LSLLPRSPQAIRHVFLTETAFARIQVLAARRGINEVGGPLAGYMTTDHALVVTAAAGPGPRGECRPASVLIDGQHATAFCAAQAELSGGLVRYVGDWHIHNGDDARPSPTDLKALKRLPRANEWGYPIVSIILISDLDHYVCIHRQGRGFEAVECSIHG
jgi:integrative and conjugative element protein (TIGR02256 family)